MSPWLPTPCFVFLWGCMCFVIMLRSRARVYIKRRDEAEERSRCRITRLIRVGYARNGLYRAGIGTHDT